MIRISIRQSSLSNMKSNFELSERTRRNRSSWFIRRLRRWTTMPRLLRRCTGQRFQRENESKLRITRLRLSSETESWEVQVRKRVRWEVCLRRRKRERRTSLIGNQSETQWSLHPASSRRDLSPSKWITWRTKGFKERSRWKTRVEARRTLSCRILSTTGRAWVRIN